MSRSSRVTALAHAACDWRCARAAVCCALVVAPWSPCMRSHCRKSHWVPSSAFRGGMICLDSAQKAAHQWRRVRSGTPAVFASVVNHILFAIGQTPLERGHGENLPHRGLFRHRGDAYITEVTLPGATSVSCVNLLALLARYSLGPRCMGMAGRLRYTLRNHRNRVPAHNEDGVIPAQSLPTNGCSVSDIP